MSEDKMFISFAWLKSWLDYRMYNSNVPQNLNYLLEKQRI